MTQTLRIDPKDATPIWSQIETGLRNLVGTGGLAPGSSVPSVRDLARDLRVNPATVSKAYQRLTEAGVFEVRRGEGTYVSASPPALRRAERGKLLRQGGLRYAGLARTLGAELRETTTELEAAWADLERGQKGKTS